MGKKICSWINSNKKGALGYFLAVVSVLGIAVSIWNISFLQVYTVIVLGGIALFQKQIEKWYFAPTIKINFVEKYPWCLYNRHSGQYLVRCTMKNDGVVPAVNCKVLLTSVYRMGTSKTEKYLDFPVHLKWTLSEFYKKPEEKLNRFLDIYPGEEAFCNLLGAIHGREITFQFEKIEDPDEFKNICLVTGEKYMFKILFSSANHRPLTKTFEFSFSSTQSFPEKNRFGNEFRITMK
jgi:hypothetical protein